jgi:hypothetical protein
MFSWPRQWLAVSGQLHTPCSFIPEETALGALWIGGWMSPRAGLVYMVKLKFLTLPGLKIWPLGSLDRSQLYCKQSHTSQIAFCSHLRKTRQPFWSSGQSCWVQIWKSGFHSRLYQIFWKVVGLERVYSASWVQLKSYLKEKVENGGYVRRGLAALTTQHLSGR